MLREHGGSVDQSTRRAADGPVRGTPKKYKNGCYPERTSVLHASLSAEDKKKDLSRYVHIN